MRTYCSGKGQIQFYSYSDNKDCDPGDDKCDIYFKPIVVLDGDNREAFKVKKTATTDNVNKVFFSSSLFGSLNDPIEVNVAKNKQMTISIKARDEDSGFDDDMHSMTGLVVPFASIGADDGWRWKSYNSDDKEAQLRIKYRIISCDDHFAGQGCEAVSYTHLTLPTIYSV